MRWKAAFFDLMLLAGILLFIEGGARFYWHAKNGMLFWGPAGRNLHYMIYPELEVLERVKNSSKEDTFDILILDGSVMSNLYGEVSPDLVDGLQPFSRKKIRIFNLAMPAHSSRDSFLKYSYLERQHFDFVLLYEGINDVRANNCPPEVFQKDYSHYSWYQTANLLLDPFANWSVLWFSSRYIENQLANSIQGRKFVPTDYPSPSWVDFGSVVKTGESFRENMSRILEMAAARHEPILVMTFAYQLKYPPSGACCGITLWGKAENVVKGLETHNSIVLDLVRQNPTAFFVDQNKLMPKERALFSDVCHLTSAGSRKFAENILPVLKSQLRLSPKLQQAIH